MLFSSVADHVGELLDISEELLALQATARSTGTDSDALFAAALQLQNGYARAAEGRMVQPEMAYAFGAVALLILAWLGVQVFSDQKRRVQSAEHQNEQNQEAILRLLDEMANLADGDLTNYTTVTEDFTGAIADSVNFTIDAIRDLVTTINETASQVSSSAQQSQDTARHLAEASERQAQEITSASTAINEMAVSINEVSGNSKESATMASRSVESAKKGGVAVRRTIDGMDSIRETIQETSKRIKRLGESSQEIGDIVELIDDIAEQTNILALNAAIQAAMAGEAGRGFAVVADEVQRLAERSSSATKQIEALVKTIQTDTNEAVISMEQSTSGVVNGARLAEDAGMALEEIVGETEKLADRVANISSLAQQQSAAASNVSQIMHVIQEITTQTSAGTSETAASIGNLADLAQDLSRSVAGFKLPG
jgi:twitching motility protein PilJ